MPVFALTYKALITL